jgi:hypothetical protein
VAVVLADVATSYVLSASKLHDQEQLSQQLQKALESRVVIEQAKGITAQRRSVSVDHAYQLMRGHARSNHASLRTLTKAIVGVGAQLSTLCEVHEDAWIRLVIYWSVRASTDACTAADAMRARAAARSKPEVRPPP